VIVAALLVCAVTLAAAWIGWYTAPTPPTVVLTEADPAVVDAVDAARRNVLWSPRSAAAWGHLGQVLRAHNFLSESNLCFANAGRFDAKDPRWPYLQGINLQMDDPETAIRHLQKAVALCGGVPDAPELCLAEVSLQLARLDDAERHFQRVLQHEPDNPRAHLGLGRLAYERGRLRDSIAHLNRSTTSKLTQKASVVLLAQVYHQLGELAAASQERTRAAELPNDPPWPDPFMGEIQSLTVGKQFRLSRLQALHRQGRMTEVRPLATKLEDDYPDVYWLVEGRDQMAKGELTAAEKALRNAIELSPDTLEAHFDLGTVLLSQKNYRAAAECFQRVIQLEPSYGPAHERLADCWRKQGHRTEAIEALRSAVRYMPQNAETHRELGCLLLQEGRRAEAAMHLEQALQLQPEDAKVIKLLNQAKRQ
jgi:tetratricopeptide (TPR) repeat protein